ncbi:hypothetical protein VTI74DRAFT_6503 [Chaetomium olivicolor]
MEALGIAASVIAVVQLTGACLKLSKKWLGPSEFSMSELNMMMVDLYAFNGVLQSFQARLEAHRDDEARILGLNHLSPVLHRCEEALKRIRDFMEKSSSIGRYLAPQFDKKLKLSLQVLERAKGLFELAVSADLSVIISKVDGYIRDVNDCVHEMQTLAAQSKQSLDIMGQAQFAHFRRADTWMNEQDARKDQEERRTILDWITPIDYAPQHNDFLDKSQAGTGKWLLNSAQYTAFLAKAHHTLFCQGMPGSGKTILTATVIEDLTRRFEDDSTVGIAYIYFNFRRQSEQEPKQLFSSLLKQLAQRQPVIPDSVMALYRRHQEKETRPAMHEILGTLRVVSAPLSRTFIVLDAVDDCQSAGGHRSSFLAELLGLRRDQKFSHFLTSRHIPDIEALFTDCPSLEIIASDEDISMYIEGHMHHLPTFISTDQKLQNQIKREIISSVDGMFLLAQLYLTALEDRTTVKAES